MPAKPLVACLIPFLMATHDVRDILKSQVHGMFGRFAKSNGKLVNEPLPILTAERSQALFDAIDAVIPADAKLTNGATFELRWSGDPAVAATVRIPPVVAAQVEEAKVREAAAPHLAILRDIQTAAKRQWPDLKDEHFSLVIQFQRSANAGDGPFHDHMEKRAVANIQLHPTGGGTMFSEKSGAINPGQTAIRSLPGYLNVFSGKQLHARPGADPKGGRLLLIVFVEEPERGPAPSLLNDE